MLRCKFHGLCTLAVALLMAACHAPKPSYTHLEGFAQGTTFSIIYRDSLERDLSPAVDSILRRVDASMSVFNDSSTLSRINRNETCTADSLLAEVMGLAREVSTLTEGAFDVTIGTITRAIGFAGGTSRGIDSTQVAALLPLVGMDKIHLNGLSIQKADPQVFIDLNAIAQGYTVDLLVRHFDRLGIANYLIEVGGEIFTRGVNSAGNQWIVGIDKPMEGAVPGEQLQARISLQDRGLATSGNYRKFVEVDGQKYSHTIDPQTGLPTLNSLLSATVLAPTAAMADALGTAFMVRGLQWSRQFLEAHPEVDAYLVYADAQGRYAVWQSAGLEAF